MDLNHMDDKMTPAPQSQQDKVEADKAFHDVVLFGTGIMKDGKHVPLEDVYFPDAATSQASRSKLRELAHAATPGPWQFSNISGWVHVDHADENYAVACCETKSGGMRNFSGNAKFIAAANPAAVLDLITLVERQEAEMAAKETEISNLVEMQPGGALHQPPEQCAAPDERKPITRIDLNDGYWIDFERKTSGANGWLLRNQESRLVRALNLFEIELVDCTLRSTLAAQPAKAEDCDEPVAYLHQVVSGDGEPDQALSFAPDNFPLSGTLGYRSISHRPLVFGDATPAPSMGEELPPPCIDTPEFQMLLRRTKDTGGRPDRDGVLIKHIESVMHAYGRSCMALRQPADDWKARAYDYRERLHAALEELAASKSAAPAQPVAAQPSLHPDLHDQIMNLPCLGTMSQFATVADLKLYKQGHRDARHAAAELAATYTAPPPAPVAAPEPVAPAILEAMSWHANERDDLTLEDAVKAFRFGWKEVRGRSEREMLAQIIELLAAAPAVAEGWRDLTPVEVRSIFRRWEHCQENPLGLFKRFKDAACAAAPSAPVGDA